MRYVDGFLLPVPRKNLAGYRRMAQKAGRLFRKHGALEFVECAGDDLKNKWGVSYKKVLKLKPGETAVFSWIVFKSKAHRNAVNAKVMKDPAMQAMMGPMPFDAKKMAYGGFRVLVDL